MENTLPTKFEVGEFYSKNDYVYAVYAVNNAIAYAIRFKFEDHNEPKKYDLHIITTFSELPYFVESMDKLNLVKIVNSSDNLELSSHSYTKIGNVLPESLYEIHEYLFQCLVNNNNNNTDNDFA